MTIIKSTHGNVFGGYTDKAWISDNQYYSDPNAFLFSLVNKYGKPFKVKVSLNDDEAIYSNGEFGPTFGYGHDIKITSKSNLNWDSYSNFGYTYKHSDYLIGTKEAQSIMAGSYHFQVADIEVFTQINFPITLN